MATKKAENTAGGKTMLHICGETFGWDFATTVSGNS